MASKISIPGSAKTPTKKASPVLATITVLTSSFGILTKEFYPDENGHLKKNSTPNFSGGSYEIIEIHSMKELKAVRCRLKANQAFMFGTPINGSMIGRITTKQRRFGRTLSRSLDCFRHPAGGGILVVDYDPRSRTIALSSDELVEQLSAVVPAMMETALVWATSAGSCIFDAVTGAEIFGVSGQRVYIMVKDGRDIARALKVIAQRLWLAGHGWFKVSKSGQKLNRTIVDLALANPVQPDFAAGAVCRPPFEQRSQQKLFFQGEPLDTKVAIPDLTPAEQTRLAQLYATAEAGVADEAKAARELWLKEYGDRAAQQAAAAGVVLTEEEKSEVRNAAVAALDGGLLSGSFVISLADHTQVTVAEILSSPDLYHEALCLDPLEPEYDDYRAVGKIFTGTSPCIYSYAHGGQKFKLIRQQYSIEWRSADSAISVLDTTEVLRTTGNFYDYGNQLVHVEAADVHVLTTPTAVHYLGLHCRFWFWKTIRGGAVVKTNCDTPQKLVNPLLDLGARRALRKLTTTSDVPVILPSGKVIATNGYDAETEIIFSIEEQILIPENPTREQVRDSLTFLWHPFSLFPYVDAGARSNCLAAILTAVVRRSVTTTLGIAVDAPQRGTGKTKLVRSVLALHCGQHPDLSPLPSGQSREEELRKKITSTLLDGRDHILFDNIVGNFDSQALAALMTSGQWADRILGKSQQYIGHARLLVGVNGNNLILSGELPRRFLQIRLDAGLENPFDRHFDFDSEELVLEQRDQLVAAAITAIRGWFAAGAPGAGTASVGSFEDWGTLVRGPLRWFAEQGLLPFDGFRDPMDSLVEAVENDPDQEDLAEFLAALHRLIEGQEVTAKTLLVTLGNRHGNVDKVVVYEFLSAFSKNTTGLSAKSIGRIMGNRRDRPAGGLKLVVRKNSDKVDVYGVKATSVSG